MCCVVSPGPVIGAAAAATSAAVVVNGGGRELDAGAVRGQATS